MNTLSSELHLGLTLLLSLALECAGGAAHSRAKRTGVLLLSVPGFRHVLSFIFLRQRGKVLERPSRSEVRNEIV